MHIGRNNPGYQYHLDQVPLVSVLVERDLGVLTSSDLKPANHIAKAYSTANKSLGLVLRTVRSREPRLLLQLYKSLVRPHVEFCTSAWSPHYLKDKHLIERVQHRFSRAFADLRHLPYEDRLRHLNLWTLEERRNRSDLITVYKMIKGLSAIPWSAFFTRTDTISTRGHSWRFAKQHCNKDLRLHFFSSRVINRWNHLPQEAVDAPSLNSFKRQLNSIYLNQMGFFKDPRSL
jgi:hypothetical protein